MKEKLKTVWQKLKGVFCIRKLITLQRLKYELNQLEQQGKTKTSRYISLNLFFMKQEGFNIHNIGHYRTAGKVGVYNTIKEFSYNTGALIGDSIEHFDSINLKTEIKR